MKLYSKHDSDQRPTGRRLLAGLGMTVAISSSLAAQITLAGESEPKTIQPTRLPSVQPHSDRPAAWMIQPTAMVTESPSVKVTAVRAVSPQAKQIGNHAVKQPTASEPKKTDWLRSGTSSATVQVARRSLDQAHAEFRVGAWLSSETSAWEAIRWAAESIDQQGQESGSGHADGRKDRASSDLRLARQAIIEARDFCIALDSPESEAISRIARSHQTRILNDQATGGISGIQASDRYLDYARIHLAAIASHSVEAAEAMDLLAAIHLRRADAKTLPSATALCLRRAAIQGQPNNPSLAANLGIHLTQVGLYSEAQWALEHSLAIQRDPATADALLSLFNKTGRHAESQALIASIAKSSRDATGQNKIRVPEITELTPEEFASLSKSVVWTDDQRQKNVAATVPPEIDASLASARLPSPAPGATDQAATSTASESVPTNPSPIQRIKNSWKRLIK